MKYAVFFFLCCLALASAAPQLLYPGFFGGGIYGYTGITPATRTLVAGPTVVNGFTGTRYVAPGYVGPTII